jgi:hypothetical protein
MDKIVFPYKSYRGFFCPIIPFEIHGAHGWLTTEAYVDSGAFCTILFAREAVGLGINYRKVKPVYVTVGDGSLMPVFYHILPIKIGAISLRATIGFSDRLGVGFNLIGRRDIFWRFDINFSDSAKAITFLPR